MQYVLLGLVLAIITSAIAAWMKMTGGNDGVADAELVDISDLDEAPTSHDLPASNDVPARHAVLPVAARHIPLVFVRTGPRVGQAWLHFADGTELLAEERVLGPLGFLAFDLAFHGPTAKIAIVPPADGCWVSVGRRNTPLRVLEAHHPEALVDW